MSTFYAYTSAGQRPPFRWSPASSRCRPAATRTTCAPTPSTSRPCAPQTARRRGRRPPDTRDPRDGLRGLSPKERLTRGLEDLMKRGPHEMAQFRADVARAAARRPAHGHELVRRGRRRGGHRPAVGVDPADAPGIPDGRGPAVRVRPQAARQDPVGRLRNRLMNRVMVSVYSKAMMPGVDALGADAGLAPLPDAIEHVTKMHPRPHRAHGRAAGGPGGPGCRGCPPRRGATWEPEQDAPDWLFEDGDPWILVTCSTEYQGDETLARAAIEGLRDEPVRVVVTLADAYGADLPSAPNARVERFVPHGPVLGAPPPSSATAAWASCRSPSPRASRWPSCRSDGTSPRSRVASASAAPA